MAVLPIGFFMPLPLPIMIPFMMWQSAAIAAGFGTYFQYAKRRVSAMSNEEFNNSKPTDLVNELFDDIANQIPSSFARIREINTLILQSLADFLEDGIKFLSGKLSPTGGSSPTIEPEPGGARLPPPGIPGFITPIIGVPNLEQNPLLPPSLVTPPRAPVSDPFIGPIEPSNLQAVLLAKYANWKTYRQKGGLLLETQWKIARRGLSGGLTSIEDIERARNRQPTGKIRNPNYTRIMVAMLNNVKQLTAQLNPVLNLQRKIIQDIRDATTNAVKRRLQIQLQNVNRQRITLTNQINRLQSEMRAFDAKFIP